MTSILGYIYVLVSFHVVVTKYPSKATWERMYFILQSYGPVDHGNGVKAAGA